MSPQTEPSPTKKPRAKSNTPRRKPNAADEAGPRRPRKAGEPRGPDPRYQDPEYRAWRSSLIREALARNKENGGPSNSRLGIPDGMRREEAEELWAEARTRAERDVAAMKTFGLMDDDAQAEEAMTAIVTLMRSPMSQKLQMKAAGQVLEWTMPKPKAGVKVSVDLAEKWLESLSVG